MAARLEVDGPDLRRTVAALEAAAPGDGHALIVEAAAGELALRLELPDDTLLWSALPAAAEGDAGSLRVNARLLRSLLDASAEARVELGWSAPAAPLVIRDVGGSGRWGVCPSGPRRDADGGLAGR